MRKYWVLVGASSLMVLSILIVSPGSYGLGQEGAEHRGRGFLADLTEEQRETIREKKKEMRSEGATREEIRAALDEMLKGYGVELPEHWGEKRGRMGFFANLTEEQRQAVREKMKEMRSQGATPEETRAAVGEMLQGYGIELPEHWGERRGSMDFFADLTEEQREAIHEKMEELRSQGASPEEVRAAIREMLERYGIELPEHPGGRPGFGHGGFRANLTEEQREAIHEKMEELRSQEATREEVQAAIQEMLEGWGIELPNHPGSNSGGTSSSEKLSASSGIAASEGMSTDFILQAKNCPNPFNRETDIAYTLNAPANVQIQIYNSAGQVVQSFDRGIQQPGTYNVHWDGTYGNGTLVTSGVYFYQIKAGTQTISKPMILLTLK